MAKNQTVPSDWDDLQQIVVDSYNDGEYSAHTPKDIHDCGDTLLTFLLVEISRREDCDSIGCAIDRLNSAMRQLTQVRAAFAAKVLETNDANVFGEQLWVGNIGVAFADLGEGRNGDYSPEDPEDEPLLRLDIMQKDEDGNFIDTDGSGCTGVSARATKEERQRFLEMAIAHVLKHVVRDKSTNFKMLCGALTWMDKDWDGVLGNHTTPDDISAILAKYQGTATGAGNGTSV